MEYVSTLCAAGTVGIAATGLVLGHSEDCKPHPSSTYRRPSLYQVPRVRDAPVSNVFQPDPSSPTTLEESRAQTSPTERYALAHDDEPSLEARLDILIQRTNEKPILRARRQTYSAVGNRNSKDHTIEAPTIPSTTGRPSSSWLRRLSTITSSVYGSSISGSRPGTPSINSSTTPFFPSSHSPNTRNKLVKRSTSQRGFPESRQDSYARPTSAASFMRRPATSHQRSAAMRHRSATDSRAFPETTPLNPPSQHRDHRNTCDTNRDSVWRPYFSRARNSISFENHLRPRSSSIRQRGHHSPPRTITNSDSPPTLLLASSITGGSAEPDDNDVGNREDQILEPASPCIPPVVKAATSAGHITVGCDPQKKDQTFSAGEPVANDPSAWEDSSSKIRRQSFPVEHTEPSTRFSDGFRSERLNTGSSQARRRRNITDPDVFQRPDASFQVEFISDQPIPKRSQETAARKPRLRHLPQFTDLRNGVLDESTPDTRASIPGTCKRSDEHQFFAYSEADFSTARYSLSNQRLSVTTSDPSSTLPGSDNDTRVFTSGEEDETDFQSDIAFDSFPTRVASNKQAPRGPRIDKIFDRPDLPSISKADPVILDKPILSIPFMNESHDITGEILKTQLNLQAEFEHPNAADLSNVHDPAPTVEHVGHISSVGHQMNALLPLAENGALSPVVTTSGSSLPRSVTSVENSERSPRMCLFDWSEQQNFNKDNNRAACRPNTAHEKQLVDARGGRTPARTAPNSLHLRSQSVPISKDPSAANESQFPLKFGTWGLGNKGPSEDWDGDFEFEDSDRPDQARNEEIGPRNVVGNDIMKVPQAILDRQATVHGQYGHVQELTVLVEDLKRLRNQAKALHIIDGPSSELWKEADGIINLATQEDEGATQELKSLRSFSSITFNFDDFETEPIVDKAPTDSTIDDYASTRLSHPLTKTYSDPSIIPTSTLQKGASAKGKSLTDVSQHRMAENPTTQHKFAFDTQSLRDLVTRAGVVTRALKEIIRMAEGVYIPHESTPQNLDPPFSQIFVQPTYSSHQHSVNSKK